MFIAPSQSMGYLKHICVFSPLLFNKTGEQFVWTQWAPSLGSVSRKHYTSMVLCCTRSDDSVDQSMYSVLSWCELVLPLWSQKRIILKGFNHRDLIGFADIKRNRIMPAMSYIFWCHSKFQYVEGVSPIIPADLYLLFTTTTVTTAHPSNCSNTAAMPSVVY